MNALPAIMTFSSCGGHREITNTSQLPEGQFYVDFGVVPTKAGWRSLERVAEVCCSTDDVVVDLTVWVDGGLRFDLRGEGDPDALAQALYG